MKIWNGYFGKSGSPVLKIKVSGPFTEGREYEAILDTGFTGFLSIPLVQAISLGLVLHGTTAVSLADGSTCYRLTARAMVKVEDEEQIGVAILEPTSIELLLGMGFLRLFKKAIFVSQFGVGLASEEDISKIVQAQLPKSQEPALSTTQAEPSNNGPTQT